VRHPDHPEPCSALRAPLGGPGTDVDSRGEASPLELPSPEARNPGPCSALRAPLGWPGDLRGVCRPHPGVSIGSRAGWEREGRGFSPRLDERDRGAERSPKGGARLRVIRVTKEITRVRAGELEGRCLSPRIDVRARPAERSPKGGARLRVIRVTKKTQGDERRNLPRSTFDDTGASRGCESMKARKAEASSRYRTRS